MPLIDGLTKILKPEAAVAHASEGAVDLREDAPEGNMCVTVTGLPAASAAIHIKPGYHASIVRVGACQQICDYLLVAESADRTDAILVELKKTRPRPYDKKPREQLRRSLPILEYLRSMYEVDSETSLRDRLRVYYWILCERASERLAKQRVRVKPEAETYKGIEIRTFVGELVSLAVMTGE